MRSRIYTGDVPPLHLNSLAIVVWDGDMASSPSCLPTSNVRVNGEESRLLNNRSDFSTTQLFTQLIQLLDPTNQKLLRSSFPSLELCLATLLITLPDSNRKGRTHPCQQGKKIVLILLLMIFHCIVWSPKYGHPEENVQLRTYDIPHQVRLSVLLLWQQAKADLQRRFPTLTFPAVMLLINFAVLCMNDHSF